MTEGRVFMADILQAIINIVNNPIPDLLSHYKIASNNRINAVGDALEEFIKDAFTNILNQFRNIGYEISYQLLNSNNFDVPQDRKRVIVVGYHKKLGGIFQFPQYSNPGLTLKDAIYDLWSIEPNKVKDKIINNHKIPNHEYLDTGFSSIYMSRNRVRNWHEPSFTIQAGGRHAPIHPQANKMLFVEKDRRIFDPLSPKPYRRLSVRECARIQTFPDNFIFKYQYINHGYKMVGNAVPVNLAKVIAKKIYQDIQEYLDKGSCHSLKLPEHEKQLTLLLLVLTSK